MIDWWSAGANALWIVGLAVLLARYSYRSFTAAGEQASTAQAQGAGRPDGAVRLGLLLLVAGLCATSDAGIGRDLWGLLAVAGVLEAVTLLVPLRRQTGDRHVRRDEHEISSG